jgi:hypothetical protein
VQSVDPGPPVALLVRMLPGQVVGDFQNRADRIAAGMDVPMVRITNRSHGLINVALLEAAQGNPLAVTLAGRSGSTSLV